jgi:hypothetical protein
MSTPGSSGLVSPTVAPYPPSTDYISDDLRSARITPWRSFEAEVQKYVESFGKRVEHQQETFKLQADAQLKAWREAADKFGSDAINCVARFWG